MIEILTQTTYTRTTRKFSISSVKIFSGFKSAEFGKAYIAGQITDHEKTVALLQSQIDDGTDADAKAFATKMPTAVKMHLEMAQKLNTKIR